MPLPYVNIAILLAYYARHKLLPRDYADAHAIIIFATYAYYFRHYGKWPFSPDTLHDAYAFRRFTFPLIIDFHCQMPHFIHFARADAAFAYFQHYCFDYKLLSSTFSYFDTLRWLTLLSCHAAAIDCALRHAATLPPLYATLRFSCFRCH